MLELKKQYYNLIETWDAYGFWCFCKSLENNNMNSELKYLYGNFRKGEKTKYKRIANALISCGYDIAVEISRDIEYLVTIDDVYGLTELLDEPGILEVLELCDNQTNDYITREIWTQLDF